MRAIIPDRKPVRPDDIRRVVRREMDRFGANVLAKTRYPPQNSVARPVFKRRTRNTTRGRKGSRYVASGYRRTGNLQRSWLAHTFRRGGAIVTQASSSGKTAPYNVRVQGPKDQQAELFKHYGWKAIPDEAAKLWPKTEKRIELAIVNVVS